MHPSRVSQRQILDDHQFVLHHLVVGTSLYASSIVSDLINFENYFLRELNRSFQQSRQNGCPISQLHNHILLLVYIKTQIVTTEQILILKIRQFCCIWPS